MDLPRCHSQRWDQLLGYLFHTSSYALSRPWLEIDKWLNKHAATSRLLQEERKEDVKQIILVREQLNGITLSIEDNGAKTICVLSPEEVRDLAEMCKTVLVEQERRDKRGTRDV